MSVISIFSGSFCEGEKVTEQVAQELDYRAISDNEVLGWASEHFDFSRDKLARALYGHPSIFSKFTREKQCSVAYLREAIAELVSQDNIVHHGYAGHLLPDFISHILKVCLVADLDFRVARAVESESLTNNQAQRRIRKEDLERGEWTKHLFEKGPWDKKLYDIKIPMHKTAVQDAVDLICENARSDIVQTKPSSQKAMHDFQLAARVNTALTKQGHDVEVTSNSGEITVVIKKYVLRLDHLRKQFNSIAGDIPGVKSVQTQEGPDFQAGYVMSRQEFELPAKVLLVDDEREFVQTLSERLQMRDVGTATVFDGEEALSAIEKEEPEVMILDLRMPGIDGIEVLRRVKKARPYVEVIILTGHGSEKDEELARELGAFAYLEKPVDIEKLTATLKEAYRKVRRDKKTREGSTT